MTFLEYLALLQRRWRSVVSMVMAGLLLALAFSLLAEKQYVAVSTSFVTVADEDAAGAGEVFQGSQFVTQRMASYSNLSSSPTVLDAVTEELDLDLTHRALKQMVDVASPTGTVMLEVSVEHTDPEQAAEISNEMSEQLALLIEEIETPRGLAASSVEVVLTHPAGVPSDPSSPRTRLNLFLGLAVGGAAGVLLALFREHFDRRVRSVDDVRAITGSKPLGSTAVSPATDRNQLVALRPRSVEAEQFRAIKAALKVAHQNELRHFVVSSPTERDDRAGETANLAVTWALSGTRVCLVDAALRDPALSRMFGVEHNVGLSDILRDDAELSTALTTSWKDGRLSMLPAGFTPQDPAEMLGSEAMRLLVEELRSRFDLVIYDAGAMAETADAIMLARATDGVVLVARAGRTTKDELADCIETVRSARLCLLGTIRSGVPATRRGDGRVRHADDEPRRPASTAPAPAELSQGV